MGRLITFPIHLVARLFALAIGLAVLILIFLPVWAWLLFRASFVAGVLNAWSAWRGADLQDAARLGAVIGLWPRAFSVLVIGTLFGWKQAEGTRTLHPLEVAQESAYAMLFYAWLIASWDISKTYIVPTFIHMRPLVAEQLSASLRAARALVADLIALPF